MRKRIPSVVFVIVGTLLAILFIASCGDGDENIGSTNLSVEQRNLPSFTSVKVADDFDVEITIGEPQSISITVDDNLTDEIETKVKGDELTIEVAGALQPDFSIPPRIVIVTPNLVKVENKANGVVVVKDVQTREFRVENKGDGTVEVNGRTDQVTIEKTDDGVVMIRDLIAKQVLLDIDGNGLVEVTATEALTGKARGIGNLVYFGEPELIDVDADRDFNLIARTGSQPPVPAIIRDAVVDEIEILELESFPLQVQIRALGNLRDACTEIGEVTTERVGNTFNVGIKTARPADAFCAQVLTPFDESISLDVLGLLAGVYTVDVNGVTDTFELTVDNIARQS